MENEDTVDKLDHLADQAVETTEDVADVASAVVEQTKEVAENFTTAIEQALRHRPVATLAGVLACAFVVGALWKI
jgi:hypothetical protein